MTHTVRAFALLACALAVAGLTRRHDWRPQPPLWRSADGRVAPLAPPGPGVRVMTFNIQHGIDGTHKYNLQSAIDVIARIDPDIVAVAEVTRNHPYYHCDDQPKLLAEGVSRATGQRWTAIYAQQWFTKNVECVNAGRGDGSATEGLVFLSPEPLPKPKSIELWNSGLGLMVESPRLPGVPIVVTHLTAQTWNGASRAKQIAKLIPWTRHLGPARVLVGDFNTWPEDEELRPVLADYHDAWSDAMSAGQARGRADGITHARHRIDYVFYAPGGRLELLWAETVDTRPLIGKEASDHRPVVAAFRLTSSASK